MSKARSAARVADRFADANPTAMEMAARRLGRQVTGKNAKRNAETIRENLELLSVAAKELSTADNQLSQPGALVYKMTWQQMDGPTKEAYLAAIRRSAPGASDAERVANGEAMAQQFTAIMDSPLPPELPVRLSTRYAVDEQTGKPLRVNEETGEAQMESASARSTPEARAIKAQTAAKPRYVKTTPTGKAVKEAGVDEVRDRNAIPQGESISDIIPGGSSTKLPELLRPETRGEFERKTEPAALTTARNVSKAIEAKGGIPVTKKDRRLTEAEQINIIAMMQDDLDRARNLGPEDQDLLRKLIRQREEEMFRALSQESGINVAFDENGNPIALDNDGKPLPVMPFASAGPDTVAPSFPERNQGFGKNVASGLEPPPEAWRALSPEIPMQGGMSQRAARIAANEPFNYEGSPYSPLFSDGTWSPVMDEVSPLIPVSPQETMLRPDAIQNQQTISDFVSRVGGGRANKIAALLEEQARLRKIKPDELAASIERLKAQFPAMGGESARRIMQKLQSPEDDEAKAALYARMLDMMLEEPVENIDGVTSVGDAGDPTKTVVSDVQAYANPSLSQREAEKFGFANKPRSKRREVVPFSLDKALPDIFTQGIVLDPRTNEFKKFDPTKHSGLQRLSIQNILEAIPVETRDASGKVTLGNAFTPQNIANIIMDRRGVVDEGARAFYRSALLPRIEADLARRAAAMSNPRVVDPATMAPVPRPGDNAPPLLGDMRTPQQQLFDYNAETFADLPLFTPYAPPFEPGPGFFEGNVGAYGGDQNVRVEQPQSISSQLSPEARSKFITELANAANVYDTGTMPTNVTFGPQGTEAIVSAPLFGDATRPLMDAGQTEQIARSLFNADVADPNAVPLRPDLSGPAITDADAANIIANDIASMDIDSGDAMPESFGAVFNDGELVPEAAPLGDGSVQPVSGSTADLPAPPPSMAAGTQTVANVDGLAPEAPPLTEGGSVVAPFTPNPADVAAATSPSPVTLSFVQPNQPAPASGAAGLAPEVPSVTDAMNTVAAELTPDQIRLLQQFVGVLPPGSGEQSLAAVTKLPLDQVRAAVASGQVRLNVPNAAPAPGLAPQAPPLAAGSPPPPPPPPSSPPPGGGGGGGGGPPNNPPPPPPGGGGGGGGNPPFTPGSPFGDFSGAEEFLAMMTRGRPAPFTPGPAIGGFADAEAFRNMMLSGSPAPPAPRTFSNLPRRMAGAIYNHPYRTAAGLTLAGAVGLGAASRGMKPEPYSAPVDPNADPIDAFFKNVLPDSQATPVQNPDAVNQLGNPDQAMQDGRVRRPEDAIRAMLRRGMYSPAR